MDQVPGGPDPVDGIAVRGVGAMIEFIELVVGVLRSTFEARWATLALAAWVGAVLASFGGQLGYRAALGAGWIKEARLPRDARSVEALRVSPWRSASVCEMCGAVLAWGAKLPLVGRLVGCRCGARGPVGLWTSEVLAAAMLVLCVAVGLDWSDMALVAAAIVLCAAGASSDRISMNVPLWVSLPLLWAGVLGSPFVDRLGVRVTGAFVLFLAPCAFMVVRSALLRWRSGSPRPALVFGDSDWLLITASGAWFGWVGAFVGLVGSIGVMGAFHGRGRMVPVVPALCAGFALALVLRVTWPDLPWDTQSSLFR